MRAFLFDTETTDLIANSVIAERHRPHIIEFYGMTLELKEGEWAKVHELEFFCKPKVRITDTITQITGITNEDIKDAKPFSAYAEQVKSAIESTDMAVAHNLSYDMAVVDTEFERLKSAVHWQHNNLCTVEATEHLRGHRLRLSDLHEELFGEKFEGAHRARTDVEAMGRCFIELWERDEI